VTDKDSSKGGALETQTAAFFQAHGFVVRRGVKLAVGSGTTEATDIDVLGFRFGVPLAEQRLVVDCKDRRKPKPFERVLWTKGLAAFAQADYAVVVLPRAPWQARDFATRGKVELLDATEIERFLETQGTRAIPFG